MDTRKVVLITGCSEGGIGWAVSMTQPLAGLAAAAESANAALTILRFVSRFLSLALSSPPSSPLPRSPARQRPSRTRESTSRAISTVVASLTALLMMPALPQTGYRVFAAARTPNKTGDLAGTQSRPSCPHAYCGEA